MSLNTTIIHADLVVDNAVILELKAVPALNRLGKRSYSIIENSQKYQQDTFVV